MPLYLTRLRRWIGAATIILLLLVGAAYFYARHKLRNAIKEVPGKIGLEIQQSAQGFTVSRSEQGRTLFKIQASKVVQFKQGGRAELHDVSITLYGSDSSRFDQIYGADFEYDPQSGDVTAKGPVQIDLEANPRGLATPDQTVPEELKNPIHLKTTDLVFNQKSGNAFTKENIEFNTPQISGSAKGLSYTAANNLLTLESQVNVTFNGPIPAIMVATRGTLTRDPRQFVLDRVHARSAARRGEADKVTLYLRSDNTLDRAVATGNVMAEAEGPSSGRFSATQLELLMRENNQGIQSAIFSGDVNIEASGAQSGEAKARRVAFNFSGKKNILQSARTEGDVRLLQHQKSASGTAQDLLLRAPAIDFVVAEGKRLARAETSGAAQIEILPVQPTTGPDTLVTAGRFLAQFDALGRLQSVHGEPDARLVARVPGQPDQVTTSQKLDATFRSGSGIQSLVQQGNFTYTDNGRKAWARQARYTLSDHMIVLDGSPRVADTTTDTAAHSIRLNRETGDAYAEGDVKSTYRDLKPQSSGALLASASPIHVTARAMMAHRSPAVAVYTGAARLWQNANILEASSIQFDRDRRSVIAQGSEAQPVSTVLVQADKNGAVTPVTITSSGFTYTDANRMAHLEGKVQAKGADVTVSAGEMDIYLRAAEQSTPNQMSAPGKIDHIIARKQVAITQPGRHANGEQLTYTAAEDKFVLTGGSPSIFDAEHGKVTGVSLTFFRTDDRVLVEGNNSHPTVTQTRVAR